jgi:uncharacterized membrane protein YtjA (UPF0391 family)
MHERQFGSAPSLVSQLNLPAFFTSLGRRIERPFSAKSFGQDFFAIRPGTKCRHRPLFPQTVKEGSMRAFENQRRIPMLSWAVTFLIIAIIAGVLGFGGIAGTSAGIAQILFFIFLVLFIVSLITQAVRR